MPRALDAIKREVFEIRSGFNMRFARHREFLTRGNLRSSTGGAVLRKRLCANSQVEVVPGRRVCKSRVAQ